MGLFSLSLALGMMRVNKNAHLVMQHPSLGSMTEGPTDTFAILMPMPMPGQEPSFYICFSPDSMMILRIQNEKNVSP